MDKESSHGEDGKDRVKKMAGVQKECIFYRYDGEEYCDALKNLYCATEEACGFCKLKGEYNADGTPIVREANEKVSGNRT